MSDSFELLHKCTYVSGARKMRSPQVYEKLVGFGRGGQIRTGDPCAQGGLNWSSTLEGGR